MLAFAHSLAYLFHIKSSSTIIGTDPTVARVRSRRGNNYEQKDRERRRKRKRKNKKKTKKYAFSMAKRRRSRCNANYRHFRDEYDPRAEIALRGEALCEPGRERPNESWLESLT